jgi:hypothetical protein
MEQAPPDGVPYELRLDVLSSGAAPPGTLTLIPAAVFFLLLSLFFTTATPWMHQNLTKSTRRRRPKLDQQPEKHPCVAFFLLIDKADAEQPRTHASVVFFLHCPGAPPPRFSFLSGAPVPPQPHQGHESNQGIPLFVFPLSPSSINSRVHRIERSFSACDELNEL